MKVIINGRTVDCGVGRLSFEEIVKIAGVSEYATVVYRCGKDNGMLIKGQDVEVKEGLIIDAAFTGNA